MAPHQAVYKCPTCKKNVTKTQKSVNCACCNLYFHICCANITADEFDFMSKHKILKFVCSSCPNMSSSNNIQEELRKGFSALSSSLEKEFELKLEEYKRTLQEKLDTAINVIKMQIDELIAQCSDNKSQVKDVKSDLKNCCNMIKYVDSSNGDKIHQLQLQSNINQRRLNRSNIIVRGLPKSISNLRDPIIKICSVCDVTVTNSDIQHCTYFGGDKAVLVKFNSVQLRDQIMINHHKGRSIRLKDIIGGDIESRIYLNDHLTPQAKQLVDTCKNLKLQQKIKKYTHLNYNVPKVRVEMIDGAVNVFNYEQCVDLLNSASVSSPMS